MKKLLASVLFSVTLLSGFSQRIGLVDAFQVKANMYPVGISLEFAEGDYQTLYLSLGVMGNFATIGNEDNNTPISISAAPYGDVQYRWYYALKRTGYKGLPLKGNSGSFFAFRATAKAEPLYDLIGRARSHFAGGAIWGMQRQYSTGFYWGGELGFGLGFDTDLNTGFVPMVNIKTGWILVHLD